VEALRELKRAVRLAKEDPVLYEHLGDAYLKNNFVNEAIEAWEKALQVDPNAPTAPQVRDKIRDTRENQLRVKGAPPKAEQK
jgi:tetratricopeptide (TPR) repeat protein